MKFMFMLFCSLLTVLSSIPSSFAEAMEARIESIEIGVAGEPHLIKLSNARVAFLPSDEKSILFSLQNYHERRELLNVELDKEYNLVSIVPTTPMASEQEEILEPGPREEEEKEVAYYPTVLPDFRSAKKIFRKMRTDYQDEAQCYNKAHIWALEANQRFDLKSMKLFLFFTNRYIREYRYGWWFHVAPTVVVPEGESVRYKVLDRSYTRGPLNIKTWTDIFIKSRRACPEAKRYTDYSRNQEKEHCYLMPVSMYFWQPRDIEARDNRGLVKTKFISSEVDHAYWEAF